MNVWICAGMVSTSIVVALFSQKAVTDKNHCGGYGFASFFPGCSYQQQRMGMNGPQSFLLKIVCFSPWDLVADSLMRNLSGPDRRIEIISAS